MKLIWTREVANPTLPLRLPSAAVCLPLSRASVGAAQGRGGGGWWQGLGFSEKQAPRERWLGPGALTGWHAKRMRKASNWCQWAHELVYFALLICDNKWFWVSVYVAFQEQIWDRVDLCWKVYMSGVTPPTPPSPICHCVKSSISHHIWPIVNKISNKVAIKKKSSVFLI